MAINQRVKQLPCDPAILLLGLHPRKMKPYVYKKSTGIISVHRDIIHNKTQKLTCPIGDKEIKCGTHPYEPHTEHLAVLRWFRR